MIDYFALALTHGLILVALLRVLGRDALDREDVQTLAEAEEAETPAAPRAAKPSAGRRRRGR